MTVLHVIEPFASGVTTFLVHLTAELRQHQHVIVHGCRTSVDTVEKVKGRFSSAVRFIEWPAAQREISFVADLRAFFALLRILRNTPADVIHLHSSKAGFIGRAACFVLRKKNIVYTPHAAAFLRTDISSRTRSFYVLLEKLANRFGGIIVSCCTHEQKMYSSVGLKTLCIFNGIPPAAHSVPIKSLTPSVCTVGLITAQKNPMLFNRIAEHFKALRLSFVWVGDGELRETLVSENIHVTGWLPAREIEVYRQAAMIYLSTSAWEGLPYAVLEAMQSGCCLVLTDTGGHQDVVVHGENGYLYQTADEAISILTRLQENPQEAIRMGNAARELSNKFSVSRMALAYNSLYIQIAK